jgi:Holliday junction resolvase RusA-like endonuclease
MEHDLTSIFALSCSLKLSCVLDEQKEEAETAEDEDIADVLKAGFALRDAKFNSILVKKACVNSEDRYVNAHQSKQQEHQPVKTKNYNSYSISLTVKNISKFCNQVTIQFDISFSPDVSGRRRRTQSGSLHSSTASAAPPILISPRLPLLLELGALLLRWVASLPSSRYCSQSQILPNTCNTQIISRTFAAQTHEISDFSFPRTLAGIEAFSYRRQLPSVIKIQFFVAPSV